MPDPQLERLHEVLRGLSSGADAGRLLRDTLSGTLASTRAAEGVVLRHGAAGTGVIATTGGASPFLSETARAAITAGRLQRRRDPATSEMTVAEPLRSAGRIVGALAVAGHAERVDPAPLPLWAEVASLTLARRTPDVADAVPDVLATVAGLAADLDADRILARAFDALQHLLGAGTGFAAVVSERGVRVGHYRGVEHDRLLAAAALPEFKTLLAARALEVAPPSHAVVAKLSRLGEHGASLPLVAGGRRVGHLFLLLPGAPGPAQRSALVALGGSVAQALLAAELKAGVGERSDEVSSLVHSMANPVVVVDEEGRLAEANGAASEVFRLADTFERGHPVRGRLGNAVLEELLTGGDDRAVEVVLGGDEQRVYRATVRRIRTGSRRAAGRVLVLEDLTSARQADAMKADFVAVIGHELRTPLTVMKGYLHTLNRRWKTLADDKREQALAALQANVSRLERLIEDLLFVSAIEQRRCKVDLELHDVGALLERHRDDRVEVRRPRRPVEVEVDQAKFDQVVFHLVDNARKYSDGPVVVELVDRGEDVEVSVSDSGPGIFSGDIPFLFERFRQLDGTSTRAHGGVGIGLYLSKRIVEALGGRIWCESRLGVGSRFAFTLPKDGAAVPAGTHAPEVPVS